MREPALTHSTIVCVDDDVALLHSLREQLLRGLGRSCEVELASSGTEALQLLEQLAADQVAVPLIICDQQMPGMRGADVLTSARRLYPQLLTVLLTGQADIDAVGKAVNQADLYRLLTKPWQEQDLVLTVKEALRRAEQERALAQRGAELAQANEFLERSVQMLRATMDATPDGLIVVGCDGQPLHVNERFVEMWSVPPPLVAADPGPGLMAHVRAQLLEPDGLTIGADGGPSVPTVIQCSGQRAVEFSGRPFELHGRPAGAVYGFRDVTERERQSRTIRHQAMHDTLSGLPNRLQFVQALNEALQDASRHTSTLAVMFVDLDHFKRINDTLGHEAGDRLLKAVGIRLQACLRDTDMVARWGGDEFTILLRRGTCGDAPAVAQRIVDALEERFVFDDVSLRVCASVGIASFPADGRTGDELLRRADMALYRVKQDGRNGFREFRASAFADFDADNTLSLEADLLAAIEGNGQLHLHYQPQFNTRTGAADSVEALARWTHPVRGSISPGVFIPIAERNGSIVKLGRWVLGEACSQAARWRERGLGDLRIAVNLAPVQIMRHDLRATVHEALSSSGLPADRLELEITEAAAMRNLGQVASSLQALRSEGVRVALDDFGTGYSSLTYLRQLPCDTLKIDRSFVLGSSQSPKDASIIRGLVTIADGMGLQTVAEGVETAATAQALQAAGCDLMQGFYFCRPLPGDALAAALGKPGTVMGARHLVAP